MTEVLIDVRLMRIAFEAERINSFVLQRPDGGALPPFTPGAHIDVHLHDGLMRSYSLLNDARERHRYVIGVKHDADSRGGSTFLHRTARVGDRLRISPPRNNFAFDEATPSSVFIAGGIGITPILSMIRRATEIGHPWQLHYASRTRADAAFLTVIDQFARDGRGETHVVFDQEAGGTPLDLDAIIAAAPAGAHLYGCGPLPMLAAFEAAAASRPTRTVHVEYFSPKEDAATDGGFEVRLGKSGRSIRVLPGQTILAALLDAGVPVSYACSEGTCGTCEQRVLEGIPDHRDVFLNDEEHAANDAIMICCSGSKTPVLALDL